MVFRDFFRRSGKKQLSLQTHLLGKNVAVNVAVNVAANVAANVAVNVAVNTKYLSERLGVNRKTIQRELAGLVEKNLIKWVGSDKTGHWKLIEKE